MDVSADLRFARMAQLGRCRDLVLVLTDLSPGLQRRLERALPEDEGPASWRFFPDLDHGLEWCEDQILALYQEAEPLPGVAAGTPGCEVAAWFEAWSGSDRQPGMRRRVMDYMERLPLEAGHVLIRQGEPSQGLYFVDEGQVTIRLEGEGGDSLRLRSRGPGTVVGEVGLYLGTPATASVVVEGTCTVYRLSAEALARMEAQAPELASAFHRAMACHLSDRLASTTEVVQALMA